MEQSYFEKMRDFTDTAAEYFDVVGKSDRDMMNNTKNYTTRLRLKREVSFESDFRKKYMTREYGNYEKYETEKNNVQQTTERGEDDTGYDRFIKNHREMDLRLKTVEGEEARKEQEQEVENLLTNDQYADQTIKDRMNNLKTQQDYGDELMKRDAELKMARQLEMSEIQYNGRISPIAKEELYRLYLKGTTIKDLSLKYGILPQRVKAVIFQRHLYWNEVYPKLGETHMRMAYEREMLYATDFPFIDYGKDLRLMAEIEKGIKMVKVQRSDIDANPPEAVRKRVEESLAKMRPKRQDFIPEDLVGKGGKAYILKNWVIHRGFGAPIVSKIFRDVVRMTGSKEEYNLNKKRLLRMKAAGPRYAAMGAPGK